jgi:hypothetical protein
MPATKHDNHGRTTSLPGAAPHPPRASSSGRTASAGAGTSARGRSTDHFAIEPLDGSSAAYALPSYCG